MFTTESLSKGCFVFKPTGSKKVKVKDLDPLESFTSESWYCAYSQVWKKIEKKLESLEDDLSKKLTGDIFDYITSTSSENGIIPTATLLTGVNLPDHDLLFSRLSTQLTCSSDSGHPANHVALLRAARCTSLKNIIEQMTEQFMHKSTFLGTTDEDHFFDSDDGDDCRRGRRSIKRSQCCMPSLLSWYESQYSNSNTGNLAGSPGVSPSKRCRKNYVGRRSKLVVIVPEFESFLTKVLNDFILILSGYASKLPIVLVLGVATTVTALNNALPHKITSKLAIQLFQSQPSIHFLNLTLEKVFLTSECPFQLGAKIFKFLTDVFLFYDFSVNGFTQGIKYCVMEHFYERPLSVLCCDRKHLATAVESLEMEKIEQGVFQLISFREYVESQPKSEQIKLLTEEKHVKEVILKLMRDLHDRLFEFHTSLRLLQILVCQLPQAPLGKQVRELYSSAVCSVLSETSQYKECTQLLSFLAKDELLSKLDKMLTLLGDLNAKNNKWSITLIEKLKSFKNDLEGESKQASMSPMKSPRKVGINVKNRAQLKEKLAEMSRVKPSVATGYETTRQEVMELLLDDVLAKALQPLTSHPLHEIVLCDKIATSVKKRMVGAPRAATHLALNNPQHYLQCNCCHLETGEEILSSMPDICIAYKLHLECGALINIHDWLLAFVTVVNPEFEGETRHIDPKIQARFTQAVAELEFLGFIKPSKRKTDHVARLTWGGTC